MFFTLLYHYLGYQPHREEIKKIIEIDNDIETASTKLNNLISEHDSYKSNFNDDDTQINTDNAALHHAKRHLDSFIINNNTGQQNTTQKLATIRALNEDIGPPPEPEPI